MITITYRGLDTGNTYEFRTDDPIVAAQNLNSIELYDNIELIEWNSTHVRESLDVLKIRDYDSGSNPWFRNYANNL